MAPADAEALLTALRKATPSGLTILGGVPAGWREGKGDASPDPRWAQIWHEVDVVSPWAVGRYADDAGADAYARNMLAADLARTQALGVDLMPVVFPGFTWANLMRVRGETARAIPNGIPRRCGGFYTRQVADIAAAGARMGYTAMFDEVDEGTAVFKLSSQHRSLVLGLDEPTEADAACDGVDRNMLQLVAKASGGRLLGRER
jgi:hypothetical protein